MCVQLRVYLCVRVSVSCASVCLCVPLCVACVGVCASQSVSVGDLCISASVCGLSVGGYGGGGCTSDAVAVCVGRARRADHHRQLSSPRPCCNPLSLSPVRTRARVCVLCVQLCVHVFMSCLCVCLCVPLCLVCVGVCASQSLSAGDLSASHSMSAICHRRTYK